MAEIKVGNGDNFFYLITLIGVFGTIGRLSVGYLADQNPKRNILYYALCTIVSGTGN